MINRTYWVWKESFEIKSKDYNEDTLWIATEYADGKKPVLVDMLQSLEAAEETAWNTDRKEAKMFKGGGGFHYALEQVWIEEMELVDDEEWVSTGVMWLA